MPWTQSELQAVKSDKKKGVKTDSTNVAVTAANAPRKLDTTLESAIKELSAGDADPAARKKGYETVASAKGGVAENGKGVFRRNCMVCHKLGSEGIQFGPDLAGLSKRLSRQEIVESLIDPSAKLEAKYAFTSVTSNDGLLLTGFIHNESADSISLKLMGGVEKVLKKSEIKKQIVSKQSSMPEGLLQPLAPSEVLDLVEFISGL
jgi:putative heme-binding domain-containing protein